MVETVTRGQRRPPSDLAAEEAVLGGMLLTRDGIATAAGLLEPGDFYSPAHGHIFDAVMHLYEEGEPADPVTVVHQLERTGLLESVGGAQGIVALQASAPPMSGLESYAKIISDTALMRRLITTANEIAELAFIAEDANEAASQAVGMLMRLHTGGGQSRLMLLADALGIVIDELDQVVDDTAIVRSGFADLDHILGGFTPGQLIVVGARPSMGKTALVLNMALHAATQGVPVLFHTLEMAAGELVKRILAAEAEVWGRTLRAGRVPERDWERISAAIPRLSELPIWIDDNPSATLGSVRGNITQIAADMGRAPGLVVIDYVQLLAGERSLGRQQEMADISRQCKLLAMQPIAGDREAKCVVVIAAQLKRSVDERKDKRPVMSDIRESGALEQDADVVLGLYRDEVYDVNSTDGGAAELQVLKSRASGTGTARLAYDGRYTRFSNLARQERWGAGE